jgi:hypothetical protein
LTSNDQRPRPSPLFAPHIITLATSCPSGSVIIIDKFLRLGLPANLLNLSFHQANSDANFTTPGLQKLDLRCLVPDHIIPAEFLHQQQDKMRIGHHIQAVNLPPN